MHWMVTLVVPWTMDGGEDTQWGEDCQQDQEGGGWQTGPGEMCWGPSQHGEREDGEDKHAPGRQAGRQGT